MTRIIAHRGASREYPENTLPAFEHAVTHGADGIELDVHATRDGVVVVHHDPTITVAGGSKSVAIAHLTIAELREFERAAGNSAVRIPRLDEVFELVPDTFTVYVELKGVGIEAVVADCLNRHRPHSFAVHAFDHRMPLRVRALCPGTAIGFLSASYPLDLASMLTPGLPVSCWQQATLIDAALVRDAHAIGSDVIAWTVNDPMEARALVALGVDALCTDSPAELRAALGH